MFHNINIATFIDINLKRKEMTYRDLIEKRKLCDKCKDHGLCYDLSLKGEKGMLHQLETATEHRFSIDTLGLWNPADNLNPLTATVLIVGQDFSNVGYFSDNNVNCLSRLVEIENGNETNKSLLKYIDLTNINKDEFFFTNAILCIKGGKMSDPVKRKWLINCSNNFLKPLILDHLKNLKIIITLGKVALDSINEIKIDLKNTKEDALKDKFSSIPVPGKNYIINIEDKQFTLYPMFHPGRLGNSNAKRVKKDPIELWKAISTLERNF
jgi:uracil-DNA glycosylase